MTPDKNEFISFPRIWDPSLLEARAFKKTQLKDIAKQCGLRVSGNKAILKERIMNFMRDAQAAQRIQHCFDRYLSVRYIQARGPGYSQPSICVNDTDFFTLEELTALPPSQLFSYYDTETKQIYGFDIRSLYLLFKKGDDNTTNPYTRQPFPVTVRKNIDFIMRYAEKCNESIHISMDSDEEKVISPEKEQELHILGLFQHMDSLGNYTDHKWLFALGRIELIKFLRELADIWSYRAQLSNNSKCLISPPMGAPFRGVDLLGLPRLSLFELRERSCQVVECLVTRGIDEPHKCLGINYVLCALTLVNKNAADALPWLYQSVM